jgi:hypothetical protein
MAHDQAAPFQIRLLGDLGPPHKLESLLPASYRTGPDAGSLSSPNLDDVVFLEHELGQGRLEPFYTWLWFAGRPSPPRPLHHQVLLGRQIFISERMDLHLVWDRDRIHLKPLPKFLLEPRFWSDCLSCRGGDGHECAVSQDPSTICLHRHIWKCAFGFLSSYAALICHESDFALAKEAHLLPPQIEWTDWRLFVMQLNTEHNNNNIDTRFIYGELRLSRLNQLQYFNSGFAGRRGYLPRWQRYGDFLREHFAWLATVTVYMAVVLTAMQVGLATTSLAANEMFQSASYGFTIFSIVGPLISTALALGIMGYVYIHNFVTAFMWRPKLAGGKKPDRV